MPDYMKLDLQTNLYKIKKMREVKAFKCEHCGKIYEEEKTCKSQEYRCYFNPRTRSCASCAFNWIEMGQITTSKVSFQFVSCLVNVDIPKDGLQTKCSKYLNRKYSGDEEIMSEVRKQYNPQKLAESFVRKNPKIFEQIDF